jgi:hypothetical protein
MIHGVQTSGVRASYSTAATLRPSTSTSSNTAVSTDPQDTVSLSPTAGVLATMGADIIPNYDNIQKMASNLTDSLDELFASAGISATPPVSLSVNNPNSLNVTVTGNRSDLQKIQDLINSNPSVQMQIHNLNAMSSQYASLAGPTEFTLQYLAAGNQGQINAAIQKYSYLLNGQDYNVATIGLSFDGSVEVDANGRPLPSNITDLPG